MRVSWKRNRQQSKQVAFEPWMIECQLFVRASTYATIVCVEHILQGEGDSHEDCWATPWSPRHMEHVALVCMSVPSHGNRKKRGKLLDAP